MAPGAIQDAETVNLESPFLSLLTSESSMSASAVLTCSCQAAVYAVAPFLCIARLLAASLQLCVVVAFMAGAVTTAGLVSQA